MPARAMRAFRGAVAARNARSADDVNTIRVSRRRQRPSHVLLSNEHRSASEWMMRRGCAVRCGDSEQSADDSSLAGAAPSVSGVGAGDEGELVAGVRWDPAQLRWVRDTRKGVKSAVVNKTLAGDEYTIWPVCHTFLVERGLQSLEPAEARREVSEGRAILLDVRLRDSYDDEHAVGALSAPLFRDIQGGRQGTAGMFDQLKKIAMGGFAMRATERNPNFVEDVAAVVGSDAVGGDCRLIVMCSIGGTLDTFIRRPNRKPYADPDR